MRTAEPVRIEIELGDTPLLDGRYLSFTDLASRVRKYEESHSVPGKKLQTRLYNSLYAGKYPIMEMYGIRFIDVHSPQRSDASLIIDFV